ncbi:MAG: amino acid racemase [Candidatus Woesearchaeota archaeon]
MRHIGLVGGLSPESTIEYYKIICSEYNKKFGGQEMPQVTIRSINLQQVADFMADHRLSDLAGLIIGAIRDLEGAGADFAAIATNSPHIAFEMIDAKSPLDLISIMEATAEQVNIDKIRTVGLIGTRFTMQADFYQKVLSKQNIKTVVPYQTQMKMIDNIIWDELVHGVIKDSSRGAYKNVIESLQERGCEGVILGCTEIPLLIKPEDSPIITYDTATLHAKAILQYALKP